MTILEVLDAASDYLSRHGVESPRLNAEHLLAHVLEKARLDLYLEFDRPLSEAERAALRIQVKNRAQGTPLQHLLGEVEFFGRPFTCDSRALIPRPETERLVELLLQDLKATPLPHTNAPSLLDVGTGTGVLALTLALELPEAQVTGMDRSEAALSLAKENQERHQLNTPPIRVTFEKMDLTQALPAGPFDLILANLPYIPTDTLKNLSREVQQDPSLALDGGADGLVLIHHLLERARNHLHPGGRLYLEIGHDQAPAVQHSLESHGYHSIMVRKDYQDIQRYLNATYG